MTKAKNKSVAGKAMWVKVFEPDTKFNPDGVYSVDLLKPQLEAAKLSDYLEGLVNDRLEEEVKSNPKLQGKLSTHLPFEEDTDQEGNDNGDIKFKFKLDAVGKRRDGTTYTQSPIVVDAKLTPMDGSVLIGNGSGINVSFEPRTYYIPATKMVGVKLHLRGVQVLDLVEYGNGAASMFDEEDGYVAAAVAKDNTAEMFDNEPATGDADDEGDF
jgi:hypothetical protein